MGPHEEHDRELVAEIDASRDAEALEEAAIADDDDLTRADNGRRPGALLVDPHLATAGESDGEHECDE
jgi:hypothetical protein